MVTEQELIEKAAAMLERSYSPYSRFPVGAALECADGAVFTGCNIENASYGLTVCAERTAAFKAVSEGHTRFSRIVIAGRSDDYCWPCGACRQAMAQYETKSGKPIKVILGSEGRILVFSSIADLLPLSFRCI